MNYLMNYIIYECRFRLFEWFYLHELYEKNEQFSFAIIS